MLVRIISILLRKRWFKISSFRKVYKFKYKNRRESLLLSQSKINRLLNSLFKRRHWRLRILLSSNKSLETTLPLIENLRLRLMQGNFQNWRKSTCSKRPRRNSPNLRNNNNVNSHKLCQDKAVNLFNWWISLLVRTNKFSITEGQLIYWTKPLKIWILIN